VENEILKLEFSISLGFLRNKKSVTSY